METRRRTAIGIQTGGNQGILLENAVCFQILLVRSFQLSTIDDVLLLDVVAQAVMLRLDRGANHFAGVRMWNGGCHWSLFLLFGFTLLKKNSVDEDPNGQRSYGENPSFIADRYRMSNVLGKKFTND